ncbi:hypothetical protein C8046_14335 [Serinibacter arcticus]|uniref:DUF4190 domain-containing protein n=1 Tax=Serinibacter arcticus TaxID=1655435 RepID=A0A2U1ZXD7_9MICO|nr:DUF4190 domain-containing protein [Serinibacter arcticus]PWD51648.1 hypothetical protein C8046_14335 [Serinibacter arcticus]
MTSDAPAGYAQDNPYGSAPAHQPYAPPSPYAPSPYASGPYAGYQVQPQNQMSLIALICSLAGLVTGVSVIAGIVCGHIALSQLRQNPQQTGRGMAIAALAVGYGLLALGAILVVLWVTLVLSFRSY